MISYQQETLFEVIDEVGPLLELHYQELTLNKERVKLDPMWERYATLEMAGAFVVYTARSEGKLIGYSAFFINVHMHYADLKVAINDVLFLHPDYRTGRTGIGLIRFCERELLKWSGPHKIVWHAKTSNDLADILIRMGYSVEETVLAKLF
jgi:hypothetical protein